MSIQHAIKSSTKKLNQLNDIRNHRIQRNVEKSCIRQHLKSLLEFIDHKDYDLPNTVYSSIETELFQLIETYFIKNQELNHTIETMEIVVNELEKVGDKQKKQKKHRNKNYRG